MTMSGVGESFRPISWLSEGWAGLRDKAHSAVTYFHPHDDDGPVDTETQTQHWGLVATDVVEHDDHFEIRIEIPGMTKEDLRVEASAGHLVVSGEKRAESTRHAGNAVVTERAFGSFKRVIPLPADVQASDASARYTDGVLAIDLPKHAAAKTEQVSIS